MRKGSCNSSTLSAFPFGLPLKVFKTCLLGRGFHTLIKNASFPSPTDVGSHNPPPFGAQRLRWPSFLSLIDVGSHNPPLSGPSILAGTPLSVHKAGGKHEMVCQQGRYGPKGGGLGGLPSIGEGNECQRGDWAPKGVDCEIPHRLGRRTKHSL